MDIATLGLEVDSRGVVRSTEHLKRLRDQGAQTEKTTASLGAAATRAFGAMAAGAAAAAASAMGIGQSVRVLREFDSAMSQVEAITGATAREMQNLRDIAADLGSTTEYTAAQAAGGLRFLGMAGFSAAESIEAIPAVLDLATAASMGLGQAADTTSNIMSAFGIQAANAADVTDVLAKAASSANTDVLQMGEAMAYAGPVASSLGISMSDTAAAIGVLGDAGIQAGRAGTALRASLASLASPTTQATDALKGMGLTLSEVNPETNSFVQIIESLEAAGIKTADAMTIFGREAAPAILSLVSQSDSLAQLTTELEGADGAAGNMADTMRDNLGGDINSLMSALQGLVITIGDAGLTSALRGAIQFLRGTVTVISDLYQMVDRAGDATKGFLSNMLGMGTTAQQTSRAIDNITLALADERTQLSGMETLVADQVSLSRSAAEAKLEEARAIRAKIDAAAAEAAQVVESSSAYRSLQTEAETVQQRLEAMRQTYNRLSDGSGIFTGEQKEALNFWAEQLGDIRAEQQALLREAGGLSEPYERITSVIDSIQQSIDRARGQQVALSGSVADTGNLGQRLKVVFDSWTGSINSAGNASVRLTNLLRMAVGAGQSLAIALNAAASSLGGVGSALSGLSGAVRSMSPTLDRVADALPAAMGGVSSLIKSVSQSTAVQAASDRLSELGGTMKMYYQNAVEAGIAAEKFGDSQDDVGSASDGAAEKLNAYEQAVKSAQQQIVEFNKRQESLKVATARYDELANASDFVKKRTELLSAAHEAGVKVTDKVAKQIDALAKGYSEAAKEANRYEKRLERLNDLHQQGQDMANDFISALTSGDAKGGLQDFWGDFRQMGSDAFSGIVQDAFSAGGGGFGAIFSGLGSSWSTMTSGISGLMSGGGLGSLGTAISGAAPIVGAVMTGVNLLKSFSSSQVVGGGVGGVLDMDNTAAYNWTKEKKSSFWGLRTSTDYDNDPNNELSRQLSSSVETVYSNVNTMIDQLGGSAKQLNAIWHEFWFDTSGMSSDQVQERLQGELEKYANKLAGAAMATGRYNKQGESNVETLERLSNSLQAVNSTFSVLGFTLQDASLKGANASSKFVDVFGSLDAFAQRTTSYYENFYTLQERATNAMDSYKASIRDLGFKQVPRSTEAFRALVDRMQDNGRTMKAMQLINLSPLYSEAMKLDEELKKLQETIGDTGKSAEEARRIAQEREGLLQQLYRLQGRTGKLRQMEIDDTAKSNRALLRRIYNLRDEQDALSEAASLADRALQGVRDAVDAQQETVQARIDQLQTERNRIEELRQSSRSVAETLLDASDSIREAMLTPEQARQQRQAAQATLQAILASGARVESTRALEKAVEVLGNTGTNGFATAIEMRRSMARSAYLTQAVAEAAMTDADFYRRRLDGLDSQIEMQEDEIERLDKVYENAQSQLEVAKGIRQGVLSIPQAISSLQSAIASLASSQRTVTDTSGLDLFDYQERIVGAKASGNTLKPWEQKTFQGIQQAANAAGNLGRELYDYENRIIRNGVADKSSLKPWERKVLKDLVPGYAIGTSHHPGGPAALHQGEVVDIPTGTRVYPAPRSREMMDGRADEARELRREVRQLREELGQRLFVVGRNTGKTAKQLERWDGEGLPAERTV